MTSPALTRLGIGLNRALEPPGHDGMVRPMQHSSFREPLANYILQQAKPPDKFSHQPRLYQIAKGLAGGQPHDDDVLYAAAWLHDLGVFVGHRPEDPTELATWDHVAYVTRKGPGILREFHFPEEKIPAVLEVIRTHLPSSEPTCFEGVVMRDADLLEQLGAVGILRTVSKVGRDTRFRRFSDALCVLQKNALELPAKLRLPAARTAARERLKLLNSFLAAAQNEAGGIDW